MQIPVFRPFTWALAAAVILATGCDNYVTEPDKSIDPGQEIRAGKAAFNSVIALEPIPGNFPSYSAAFSINDLGQAVGESNSANGNRAVIWDNSTIPQDLGTIPGGTSSSATAISNDGRVIMGASRDATDVYMVRWLNSNGQWLIDVLPSSAGCFPGGISSDGTAIAGTCAGYAAVWVNGSRILLGPGQAFGVNSKGQAVGTNYISNQALLWTFLSGTVTETNLGTLGGTYAVAININDAGQVTGWSENADHVSHAFLWSPRKGTMVDLAPGSPITGGGYSINATGKVSGDMFPSSQHGGYYDGRRAVDLGVLPGYYSSMGHGLNNNGQIVGWSSTLTGQTRATMWVLK
jgi:probable HAF family extracellular repeat protein